MQIRVNGEAREVSEATTVSSLLDALALPTLRGIALAVNGHVVPRSQWETRSLDDGDAIEIIQATQGG